MAFVGRKPKAPFKIPEEIVIDNRRWKIIREDKLQTSTVPKAKKDIKGYLGLTHRDHREIHLRKHSNPLLEASTFLHELMHACSDECLDYRDEEKFIRGLEAPLLAALSQLEWINGKKRNH